MNVTLEPFAVDLVEPLSTAAGAIERREGIVVDLRHDGVRGIGEATPLPGWTESMDDCRTALAGAADRLDADEPEAVLDALDATPAARHGLSLALADLQARRADRPLFEDLGSASYVDSVPVNATIGDLPADAVAERVSAAVSDGFDCVKLKVGGRSLAADERRVAAARRAAGEGIELRVDANGSWSRKEARRALSWLDDHDVRYVEQPLPADDLAGNAGLRGGDVGIALDEGLRDCGIDAILDAGVADAVVLKPMALGGIDHARAIALRAREAGLEVVVTTTIDAVLARTAAVHLAASLSPLPACGLATGDLLASDLGPDPAPVSDGTISVPDGPGLGVAPESLQW